MDAGLPKHELVLLGIGHTNAHVLRMWRMQPLPDTRLTCVSNHPVSTYSGMLPGVLSGQYSPSRMEIDLVRLCASAGARLIVGHVIGLDRDSRQLLFDDRVPVPFDALSIGIGSVPDRAGLELDESVVAIKPMQTFLQRLEGRLDQLLQRGVAEVRVVVVGAGAGGVETTFCLKTRLRAILGHLPCHLTLINANGQVIGGVSEKTSRLAQRELESRGVTVRLNRRVTRVAGGRVTLDNDEQVPAEVVIWATNAKGPPLLSRFHLPLDEHGFILTRPTLQSLADDAVFAVGDTGSIQEFPTPKAGVYAVRQGPVLWENLQRFLRQEPLQEYRPQRKFLKLFNTGDERAIGEFRGWTFSGEWAWKLKDWIDARFMDKYQDYQPMSMSADDRSQSAATRFEAKRMRCVGCGGKIGGAVLSSAIKRLDVPASEHVVVGLAEPDDAAILRPPPGGLVNLTVDFFAAPFDDAYLVGRIAALNAASDCFAMGAQPLVALASATLPLGPPRQQEQVLFELLAGALNELRPMGATLAGGHTIEGPQLTIGFTMFGSQPSPVRTKGKLREGDYLILTKPIGTGVLLAGLMQARCRADWWEPLLHSMLLSNQYAASLCEEFQIEALTDITGFGLAGHLLEMLRPSGLAAEITLEQLPLLPGACELAEEGLESTLAPANRNTETDIETLAQRRPEFSLLFDPQTSGGLLMGVSEAHVHKVLNRLTQQSAVPPALIGRVVARATDARRLRVSTSRR